MFSIILFIVEKDLREAAHAEVALIVQEEENAKNDILELSKR